jgi:1-acyl-sn-glycerol-3-phosphate acyltransferase
MSDVDLDTEVVVHNGEVLPILSSSAKKMNMEKLLRAPLPVFDKSTPGSPFWTWLGFWFCRRVSAVQFRTTSSSTVEDLNHEGGSMCCGWHTNGLMDPLGIFLQHPKEFVVGSRHDLVTRPLLGWWTRRLAVQPVVRKAELVRGGCSEEEANHINGRSLLSLASGISHGFGCVLFPEGTSHDKSHMIRFRTGPMRTVLAAAALAKANGQPMPKLVPTGLHFRTKEYFRTDQYIEFGQAINIDAASIPNDMVEAVRKRDWVEPPVELVHQFRDELERRLPELTPHAQTWDEHRGFHLIAHVKARVENKPLKQWSEEVHAAREVRSWYQQTTELPPTTQSDSMLEQAIEAGAILEKHRLDGRDLGHNPRALRKANPIHGVKSIVRWSLFALFIPLFLLSLGFQLLMGRLLGDSTDEGLDARTSFQFLAAMFGSMIVWPIVAIVLPIVLWWQTSTIESLFGIQWLELLGTSMYHQIGMAVVVMFASLPLFWVSGHLFAWAWDDFVDARKAWNRKMMSKNEKIRFSELIEAMIIELQSR